MISDAPQIAPSIDTEPDILLERCREQAEQMAPVTAPIRPKKITSITLSQEGRMTAERPATAIPAPRSPPTMAWLLESGIPARVATNTRMMAVPMATTMERGVSPLRVTMAVPMVAATAVVNRNGPTRLQTAVEKTAFIGESAFVATTVAIECDASLRPLTKFSASARMIPNRMSGSMPVMNVPSRCH